MSVFHFAALVLSILAYVSGSFKQPSSLLHQILIQRVVSLGWTGLGRFRHFVLVGGRVELQGYEETMLFPFCITFVSPVAIGILV